MIMAHDIRTLFEELGLIDTGEVVGDSDPLFDSGLLDSIGLIDVLSAIEARYGVRIDPDDLNESTVGSLDAIASYLQSRYAPAQLQ